MQQYGFPRCHRRNLNPCSRRESGMAKRNSKKLQEHGRTGWRSRSSKKHLIVSPMCPRSFNDSELSCSLFELSEATVEGSLFRGERKRIYNDLERTDDNVSR
jgi:hypothetical protein